MRRTGAVRWIAALAVVFCTATALPDPDGPPGSRFVKGKRIRRVRASYAYYPDRPNFVARSADEWAVLAEEYRIRPEVVRSRTFDRRMVVGILTSSCGSNLPADVLGAVIASGGAATIRWRRVGEVDTGHCADSSDSCALWWLLWSFPRADRKVRFRRQPTRWVDCFSSE